MIFIDQVLKAGAFLEEQAKSLGNKFFHISRYNAHPLIVAYNRFKYALLIAQARLHNSFQYLMHMLAVRFMPVRCRLLATAFSILLSIVL